MVRVSGNQLSGGNGSAIHLHGANFSGTEFMCVDGNAIYGGPADIPSTYAAMRSWNINSVRVPLNEDCWLSINGVNPSYAGANYQNAIVTEVNTINQAGMIAILDLHWSGGGSNLANGQAVMADADHSPAFWSSVANTFRNNHAVIFDLFNEPHPHDAEVDPGGTDPWGWKCWQFGCTINPGGGLPTWQAAGMQSLIDAVRSTGATTPLLVNGNGWSNDDSGWLAAGLHDSAGQLIAGLHSYPWQNCQLPSCWTNSLGPLKPIAQRVPMIIGETGDSSNGTVTYMNQELPFAQANGLSFLAWTWNPWGDQNAVLIRDWSGTPTAGEGAYYRSFLAGLPQF